MKDYFRRIASEQKLSLAESHFCFRMLSNQKYLNKQLILITWGSKDNFLAIPGFSRPMAQIQELSRAWKFFSNSKTFEVWHKFKDFPGPGSQFLSARIFKDYDPNSRTFQGLEVFFPIPRLSARVCKDLYAVCVSGVPFTNFSRYLKLIRHTNETYSTRWIKTLSCQRFIYAF